MRRAAVTVVALAVAGVMLISLAGAGGGTPGGTYQVRAIFDNAQFAVSGEDVRIAGANVGSIASLAVTRKNQAAVTLDIQNREFVPFHANATCAIRPQSLIAENYIDCQPGTSAAAPLQRIRSGAGAGSYLLPVTRTSSPIDPDIVQNISQQPVRQSLSIILDELGTGLAARGSDLNAVILRADPALGYTDRVFKILAVQNRTLAQLATDSDAVLAPLARVRRQVADFIVQANTTAGATAQQRQALRTSIARLPGFLHALRPLMADLGQLADQGTPLMNSLGASASGLNQEFTNLTPFAGAARTALIRLGDAAHRSQRWLVGSEPLARRLLALGNAAQPSSRLLSRLTTSLNNTGAIQQLMGVLFYGTQAINGFNKDGHYVRTDILVGSCTGYARTPTGGCSANFGASRASAAVARQVVSRTGRSSASPHLSGLLHYLVGGGA
ncbi:MAG TPA: MlaD family protein [Solirubrobacteraceae bacterium]|nr:MlaD family protein [Solirubrobacteraceae bacterium]